METVLYLVSNLFRIFAMYQFSKVFYTERKVKASVVFLAYAAFFLLNSAGYLFAYSLPMNMMTNLVPYFLIAFLYETKLSVRCIATLFVFALALACDGLVIAVSGFIKINEVVFSSGLATALLIYLFARLFSAICHIRNYPTSQLGVAYFIALLFIPIGSIFIANATVLAYNSINILTAVVLLGMNAMVFFLYDVLLRSQEKTRETEQLAQQGKYYQSQMKLMEQSQAQLACLRHDMRNHLSRMDAMLQQQDYEKLSDYLKRATACTSMPSCYVQTGNADIDCMVNYKLAEAERIGAEITAKAVIPPKLDISAFDMTVILGNLLDNATKAVAACEKKQIMLSLQYQKNVLTIVIKNTYDAASFFGLQTNKPNQQLHGYGLQSVRNAVAHYNGTMEIKHDEVLFTAKVLLFNS